MSIFDKPDYGPRELPEEGKHSAVLYSIVDLGSREDTYKGETRDKHEVYVCWELPETKMKDGRPFVIGKTYSVTDGNFGMYFAPTSNIHKMLRAWTGLDEKSCKKPSLLGKLIKEQFPATITIEHATAKDDATKVYANIESIKPFKGKNKPVRINDVLVYELGGPNLEALPAWQQDKIRTCLENTTGVPKRGPKPEMPEGLKDLVGDNKPDEDIPF